MESYLQHEEARKALGIPALPLSPEQVEKVCSSMESPKKGEEEFLLQLFTERIAPGVDASTKVKAEFLNSIISGEKTSPLIDKKDAIRILGTMMGGYNVQVLVEALKNEEVAKEAAEALKQTILVYDAFETVCELSKTNEAAKSVVESWANAEWFTKKDEMPSEFTVKVFKVEGEINTDDFSPASEAFTRPDIPLHALSMGRGKFDGGNETIAEWRKDGHKIAFVGDVVGTGSSRKSACNSLMWHIGEDIPFVPNKRNKGIVIGGSIAPIFFNTTEDSGGLPILTDVTSLNMGDEIVIDVNKGEIKKDGEVITTFRIKACYH